MRLECERAPVEGCAAVSGLRDTALAQRIYIFAYIFIRKAGTVFLYTLRFPIGFLDSFSALRLLFFFILSRSSVALSDPSFNIL